MLPATVVFFLIQVLVSSSLVLGATLADFTAAPLMLNRFLNTPLLFTRLSLLTSGSLSTIRTAVLPIFSSSLPVCVFCDTLTTGIWPTLESPAFTT